MLHIYYIPKLHNYILCHVPRFATRYCVLHFYHYYILCCIFTTHTTSCVAFLQQCLCPTGPPCPSPPLRGVPKQIQNTKTNRLPTPPFARRLQTYTYSVRFRHRLARIRKWQYDRGGTPKKIKTGTKQS